MRDGLLFSGRVTKDDGNSPAIRAMIENLGLEDLKSPKLQAEAEQINTERSQLVARLQQLNNLALEIPKAEQFLQPFHLQVDTDFNALGQVLSWFDQLKPSSISPMIWIECQTAFN